MTYVPDFAPTKNAPLFSNGPWPPGSNLAISIPGLPPVTIDVTKMGLCGGMSFLTRDIYESHAERLRNTDPTRIPAGLVQLILQRLIDSFGGGAVVAKWLALDAALDHDTVLRGPGLFRLTVGECAAIMSDVDAGVLCPIGVVLTESFAPWAVFDNHVVLVWGYDLDGGILTLHTYDCNFPDQDDIFIRLDISAPAPAKTISTNGTDNPSSSGTVRGFFRLPYAHKDPSPAYIDDASAAVQTAPPAQMATGAQTAVLVTAVNTGSTTWSGGDGYRLGSQDPQDNTTWGLGRVELPGPVDPQGTASFEFEVTAPSQAGDYGFSWEMVREGVRWFGNPTAPLVVAVGDTGTSVCAALHTQHLNLADQLQNVQDEIATIDWSDPFTARHEAAALARAAAAIQAQIRKVEDQQTAIGCAPV